MAHPKKTIIIILTFTFASIASDMSRHTNGFTIRRQITFRMLLNLQHHIPFP